MPTLPGRKKLLKRIFFSQNPHCTREGLVKAGERFGEPGGPKKKWDLSAETASAGAHIHTDRQKKDPKREAVNNPKRKNGSQERSQGEDEEEERERERKRKRREACRC